MLRLEPATFSLCVLLLVTQAAIDVCAQERKRWAPQYPVLVPFGAPHQADGLATRPTEQRVEVPENPLRHPARDGDYDFDGLRNETVQFDDEPPIEIERLPRTDRNTTAQNAAKALASEGVSPGSPRVHELPALIPVSVGGDFPALPPNPNADEEEPLPPLDEELWQHGGAHLYEPEGDRRNWPESDQEHFQVHRLPEDWQKPKPWTTFQEFLGADPVHDRPGMRWPGPGYAWEPRFVASGSYEVFAIALEENNRRQDLVGHQLIADLDLRLTGTERFHVQFRPLGENNTGGSYYQFSNPEGYVDNLQGMPDRYWFEAEVHSLFGSYVNPFSALDYHMTVGRFPFALHNNLLMNDEFLGVALNKNNIYCGPLSNLNVQLFYGFNDVSAFAGADGQLYGVHASADYHNEFWQATYAFVLHEFDSTRNSHFAALSRTKLCGPWTVAMRGLFKYGDPGGSSDGQLFSLETNHTRVFDHEPLGVEKVVFFCNSFLATSGWNPIAGGNFNRLRTTFEVNPLVQISAGRAPGDTWGTSLGVQLFRHHEDESIIPEIAFESPGDEPVWGCGVRYLRKTGARSYFEVLGVFNFSDDARFRREGVFLSETIVF